MLTQRPGLRAAAVGQAEDAVITDFAAVLDFLGADQLAVAQALRVAGTAGNPQVACVISGLRRLPSFAGAVFSSASVPRGLADRYTAGTTLIEPAFVRATSSRLVELAGDIDYVIWSQTGKRVAALAVEAGPDEILFAPGAAYKVLGVDKDRPAAGPVRVFLRELASSSRVEADGTELDEMDRRVLERLVTAAALRDEAVADGEVSASRPVGAMLPVGLDERGLPFLELAANP
jgi:uncharacterized membrane protein